MIRLFNNIIDNAYEYLKCFNNKDAKFSITSNTFDQWYVINFKNSYFGKIQKHATSNLNEHGWGLKIADEIIEKVGGFIVYQKDKDRGFYQVTMHFKK